MLGFKQRYIFFEDGGVIKVVRGSGEVSVDKGEQLKIKFFSFLYYFDKGIHSIDL